MARSIRSSDRPAAPGADPLTPVNPPGPCGPVPYGPACEPVPYEPAAGLDDGAPGSAGSACAGGGGGGWCCGRADVSATVREPSSPAPAICSAGMSHCPPDVDVLPPVDRPLGSLSTTC